MGDEHLSLEPPCHIRAWSQLEPWLRLFHIPGLGPVRYRALLEEYSGPEQILSASEQALSRLLPKTVARAVTRVSGNAFVSDAIATDKAWLERSERHHILTITDPRYPALLKTIPDPPVLLYVHGQAEVLCHKQLAMVGCRQPTAHGLSIAFEMAEQGGRSRDSDYQWTGQRD